VAAVAVVTIAAVAAAPASLATQFLPPRVHADGLTGTLWHGSTERLSFDGRRAGALEWQLHPAAMLGLRIDASVQWALGAFSAHGVAAIGRSGMTVTALRGGGPIEDLASLGVPAGWHGTGDIEIERAATDFSRITALTARVSVTDLAATQVARGAPLGNYVLNFPSDAVDARGTLVGSLDDAGGPLAVHGTLSLSPFEHTGTLSATLRERPDASDALRSELEQLASMRGRDRDGRIPVDLELSY
jgi:hypothetical protein